MNSPSIVISASSLLEAQELWEVRRAAGVEVGATVHSKWPIAALTPGQIVDGNYGYTVGRSDVQCAFDEPFMVAVCHPQYDGFLTTSIRSPFTVGDLKIAASPEIAPYVDAHYARGALYASQRRPIDIELHPGNIPRRGVQGKLRVIDGQRDVSATMTLTLASVAAVECEVAEYEDGSKLHGMVNEYIAGTVSLRKLVWELAGKQSLLQRVFVR